MRPTTVVSSTNFTMWLVMGHNGEEQWTRHLMRSLEEIRGVVWRPRRSCPSVTKTGLCWWKGSWNSCWDYWAYWYHCHMGADQLFGQWYIVSLATSFWCLRSPEKVLCFATIMVGFRLEGCSYPTAHPGLFVSLCADILHLTDVLHTLQDVVILFYFIF